MTLLIQEYIHILNEQNSTSHKDDPLVLGFFFKESISMKFRLIYFNGKYYLLFAAESFSEKVKASHMNSKLTYSLMLINSLSHELFTPLHHLIGGADALSRQLDSVVSSGAKDEIISLKQIGLGLNTFVQNMLDYANILSDSFSCNIKPVKVIDIFDYVMSIFSIKTKKKKLKFETDVSSDLVIDSDFIRLAGLLFIFVDNSLKFTNKGGISLKAEKLPGKVVFRVIDTGCGIDQADLNTISQIISNQFLEEKTKSAAGLGVGFRIAQTLLKKLSNTEVIIEIISELGLGTTIQFEILTNDSQLPRSKSKSTNKEVSLKRLTGDEEAFENFMKERNTLGGASRPVSMSNDLPEVEEKDPSVMDRSHHESDAGSKQGRITKMISISVNMSCKESVFPKFGFENSEEDKIEEEDEDEDKAEYDDKEINASRTGGSSFDSEKKNIMIVDDDIFNLEILKDLLQSFGIKVHSAYDGERAIEICLKFLAMNHKVDLIFMDYNMPNMNGDECTKTLKTEKFNSILSETPIIGITAHSDAKTKEKCLEAGMTQVENKPFTIIRLKEILKQYNII